MKLIRWLLSNILVIAFVLALAYIYVYWDNLTGDDTPAGKAIAWVSEEFEEVEGLLDYLKVTSDKSVKETKSQQTEQFASASKLQEEETISENTVEQALTTTALPPAVTPEPVNRYVTPEIEQSLARVADDGAIDKSTEETTQTTRELWINARKLFHRGDFEGSISSYEQLIAKSQDNFDAYGELGNVYYYQGNMEKAAENYYQAAAILVHLGQTQRAGSLIGMLSRFKPEKAKELRELITSASS